MIYKYTAAKAEVMEVLDLAVFLAKTIERLVHADSDEPLLGVQTGLSLDRCDLRDYIARLPDSECSPDFSWQDFVCFKYGL